MRKMNNGLAYSADELNDEAFQKAYDRYLITHGVKYTNEDDFLNDCYENEWLFYENGDRYDD